MKASVLLIALTLPLFSFAGGVGPDEKMPAGFEESILRGQADDMGEREFRGTKVLTVRKQADELGNAIRSRQAAAAAKECKSHSLRDCHACSSTEAEFNNCVGKSKHAY